MGIELGNPQSLILLGLVPLAVFLLWLARLRVKGVYAQIQLRHLAESSSVSSTTGSIVNGIVLLVTVASLIVALAAPHLEQEKKQPLFAKLDLVVLLDRSLSMRAEDIPPSRLARAGEEIRHLFHEQAPFIGRVGLVGFAGSSLILSYLTEDPENVLYYLKHLEENREPRYGTDIGRAIESGLLLLEKERQLEPNSQFNRVVFILISDGEDQGTILRQNVLKAIEANVSIYCIGLGTRQGGLIPMPAEGGEATYLKDEIGQPILARFDESTLRWIADQTGAEYFRSATGTELAQNLAEILLLERRLIGHVSQMGQEALDRWFLILGFVGMTFLLFRC